MKRCLKMLCMVLAACGTSEGEGMLRVYWEIGANRCEDVPDLKSVRVRVLDGDVDEVTPVTAPCLQGASSRGLEVKGVPAGRHDVLVEGIGPEGKPWYEAWAKGVTVKSDQETTVNVNLVLKPASIHVMWHFDNGKLCPANQVETMEIGVFDAVTNAQLFIQKDPKQPVLCKDGEVKVEGVDANREVWLKLFGIGADGKRKYWGRQKVQTIPGEVHEADVTLKPCTVSDCG